MYKKRSQGFTLIELLVVIAIIGILSAIVLASLNVARQKGNDAAIQSDLSTIQTQSMIYYGGAGNNSFGTVAGTTCSTASTLFSDATIVKAIAGAANAAGGSGNIICGNSTSAYAVEAKLTAPATLTYWCVDSTGSAKQELTASTGGFTFCP